MSKSLTQKSLLLGQAGSNPFLNVQEQIKKVNKYLKLKPEIVDQLMWPERVIEVRFPIKMDNGERKMFIGYRSQHNRCLGPYKGGIRFHPNVSKEEVMALSTWMTWKCAVAGISFGGGKGGVIVDPKTLSISELKRLSQAYVRAIAPLIGPRIDVPAPDVNTDGQIMEWMVKEYIKNQITSLRQGYGRRSKNSQLLATFTGKPIKLGGSLGREQATGRGGVYVLTELSKHLIMQNANIKIVVQGFGNVGYWFAKLAEENGFQIVAVGDSRGGIVINQKSKIKNQNLDMDKVMEWKNKTGSVIGYPGTKTITNDQLLITECDVVVPAALENVITKENARKIKAKIVLEMANGPTTPEADEILKQKRIIIIPDILANSGGVSVSYFEWLQNLKNEHWTEKEVNRKLKALMKKAFKRVWQVMKEKKLDGRTAAYVLAVERVARRIEADIK